MNFNSTHKIQSKSQADGNSTKTHHAKTQLFNSNTHTHNYYHKSNQIYTKTDLIHEKRPDPFDKNRSQQAQEDTKHDQLEPLPPIPSSSRRRRLPNDHNPNNRLLFLAITRTLTQFHVSSIHILAPNSQLQLRHHLITIFLIIRHGKTLEISVAQRPLLPPPVTITFLFF